MAGKNLSQYLKDEGITQDEFSKKHGIPQSTVSRICSGGDTTPKMMRKLHAVTGGAVTPDCLVLKAA